MEFEDIIKSLGLELITMTSTHERVRRSSSDMHITIPRNANIEHKLHAVGHYLIDLGKNDIRSQIKKSLNL